MGTPATLYELVNTFRIDFFTFETPFDHRSTEQFAGEATLDLSTMRLLAQVACTAADVAGSKSINIDDVSPLQASAFKQTAKLLKPRFISALKGASSVVKQSFKLLSDLAVVSRPATELGATMQSDALLNAIQGLLAKRVQEVMSFDGPTYQAALTSLKGFETTLSVASEQLSSDKFDELEAAANALRDRFMPDMEPLLASAKLFVNGMWNNPWASRQGEAQSLVRLLAVIAAVTVDGRSDLIAAATWLKWSVSCAPRFDATSFTGDGDIETLKALQASFNDVPNQAPDMTHTLTTGIAELYSQLCKQGAQLGLKHQECARELIKQQGGAAIRPIKGTVKSAVSFMPTATQTLLNDFPILDSFQPRTSYGIDGIVSDLAIATKLNQVDKSTVTYLCSDEVNGQHSAFLPGLAERAVSTVKQSHTTLKDAHNVCAKYAAVLQCAEFMKWEEASWVYSELIGRRFSGRGTHFLACSRCLVHSAAKRKQPVISNLSTSSLHRQTIALLRLRRSVRRCLLVICLPGLRISRTSRNHVMMSRLTSTRISRQCSPTSLLNNLSQRSRPWRRVARRSKRRHPLPL